MINEHNNQNEDILIHLHMPKTGGTTLKKIIKKNYDKSQSFDVYVDHQQLPQLLKDISSKKVQCIQGHIPFGIQKYFHSKSTYITMLRDPIDRIISEYYFIRNIEWHNLHSQVMNMSLEEYQKIPTNCNLQTHYILGEKFGKKLVDEDLEKAKKILLEHFSVVGITEMFDESVFLMKETFGWKDIFYKKFNVSNSRLSKKEIPFEVLQQIAKNNSFDLQLYSFGKKLVEEKLDSLDIKAQKRLKLFSKQNKYWRHMKRNR
ncbi:sulfotransferase family 2 domain-containing protein [Bacillus solitudinis]|uniref:sulfotransferase family 2 domain-containing protein n=1 Tax=Bacillus solitudinis TaxID=2014074 RepID=UPI000C2492AD|nr:sulfotransferase family 2 domain-containing protein [Bacillus solitudinis]